MVRGPPTRGSLVAVLLRFLSDVVVVVHFGFIVFVAVGGFLAWRWRWVVWLHLAAVIWGAAIIAFGFDCPLTPLENELRARGGEIGYEGGFVDRYIENVVYPDQYTPHLRVVAAALITVSYAKLLRAHRRRPERDEAGSMVQWHERSGQGRK